MSRAASLSRVVPVLALALLFSACGDGGTGPADVIPAALAATWVASPDCAECGFTLTSDADPADSLNVVSFFGLTIEMTLTRSGAFHLSGGGTSEVGTARVEGSMLIVTAPGTPPDTIDYTLRGDLLDVRLRRIWLEVDFDGDQVEDPAHASGTFRRRP